MPDRSRPVSTTTAPVANAQQGDGEKLATAELRHSKLKLTKDICTVGTWNVRTLYARGKLRELFIEMERYTWNILGLIEVRWTQSGDFLTDEEHKLWFSREEKEHRNGVGSLVHKENVNNVLNRDPVSTRIITIRMNASPNKLTIIQVYAPTTDHPDDEVEAFYQQQNDTSSINEVTLKTSNHHQTYEYLRERIILKIF